VIRNVTAGAGFLLAALALLGAEETVLKVVEERARAFRARGDDRDPRILAHRRSTVLKYLRTLVFLPVFGMKRPIELDDYEGRALGMLASPRTGRGAGGYRSTDRFLRELTALGPGRAMGFSLAADYCEAFYPGAYEEGMRVFIDGHFKAVWTLKNIPRGKHGMMDRVMTGLAQVFLNGPEGHPLLHTTHPGDMALKDHVLPHVQEFERAVGREVVNLVVVDNEGCSQEMFEEFAKLRGPRERKVHLVTLVRKNQYRYPEDFGVRVQEDDGTTHRPLQDGDFQPFHRDRRGRVTSRVALAEFNYLANANRRGLKGELTVRCAVVRKVRVDKTTVIVTDAPWETMPSGEWLARCYYDRWPCQEARFKEMAWLCNLNVNHGFGKDEVPNRMVLKQLDEVSRSLAFCERRAVKLGREIDRLDRLISAGEPDGLMTRKRREKRATLWEKRKGYLEKVEKHREELAEWEERLENEPLYEIRTEMDHVMSVLKVLLENMCLYVHDRFFDGGPPNGLVMLLRTFIDHPGDLAVLEDKDDGLTYRFVLNGFDNRRDRRLAREACERVNRMAPRTVDGVRIEMAVKRR
jgi:hypothetical protein